MKSDEEAHALRCFEQALVVARNDNNKFDKADALDMLGKVYPLPNLKTDMASQENISKKLMVIVKVLSTCCLLFENRFD